MEEDQIIFAPISWPGVRETFLLRIVVFDADWVERLSDAAVIDRIVAVDPSLQIPRAAVGDARLVPATIAAAVGLELGGGEAQRVAQALADRRLLLVLDTCEHVIAAIARVAEAMLGMSSAPHIIATSREALRAGGERVYPVQPLAVPAENVASVDDLLQ